MTKLLYRRICAVKDALSNRDVTALMSAHTLMNVTLDEHYATTDVVEA